ncbi:hypothetical protein J2S42_005890 [Catenuloplanes indicus]|uniref:Uncharacterized protein n=2 Tax=Catenuloplanes indicus TaxID=137267 RepID=A0AAE3W4C6_9ACTN|nr:hypothetical protein [Catenuloplanes indicus]
MAFGLVAAMPSNALAAAAAEPAKGQEVCKLSDEVLSELSGIAAYEDGYFVINDGSDNPAEATKVFYLDGKCKLQGNRTIEYPGEPADTEDMVLSPDGKTLWVGDVGDNEGKRATIGLFKIDLTAESPEPVYYPVRYPGDNAPNAEALLVNGDGTPIVVTKEAAVAHFWIPAAPLEKTADGIELKQAGEWKIPLTETSTWLGVPGRLAVTGGAVAPGGAKVALRTYADAFEWDVQNGDVIAAVTGGEPRITGLPDESFGEAITYAADGASYITVSEVSPGQTFAKDTPKLLKYAPTHNAVQAQDAGGDGQGDDRALWEKLSLGQITAAVVSVGVVGLLMLIGGILGIVMFRRRNPVPDEEEPKVKAASAAGLGDGDSPEQSGGWNGAESSGANRREPAAAGAVYGAGGAARSGGVYGGGPAGMNGGGSGAVYGAGGNGAGGGAARGGGGVYGGGPAGMNGGGSGAVYGAGAGPGDGGKAGAAKSGGVYGGGPAGMNGGGSGAVYGAGGGRAAGRPDGSGQGPRGGGRGPQDPQQSGGVYGGGPAGMNGGGSGAVYGAGGAGGQGGGGQGGGGRGPGGGGRGPGGQGGGPRGGGQGGQDGPRGAGQGGPGGGPRGGQAGPGGGPRGAGQGGADGPRGGAQGARGGAPAGPGGPRGGQGGPGGGPRGDGGPGGGGRRGPQQSGGNPQQGGGNPLQSGGIPQAGRGPQQGGRGPQQGGRGPQQGARGPQQGGGVPQGGRGPQQGGRGPQDGGRAPQQGGGGRPPRQGGSGVYGGGPAGMNGGGSGAVYGGGDGERSGGHDRRDDQRGGYPQNPPYDDRRR